MHVHVYVLYMFTSDSKICTCTLVVLVLVHVVYTGVSCTFCRMRFVSIVVQLTVTVQLCHCGAMSNGNT